MFHWNTNAIKKILEAALPTAVITVESPGGDFDTEEINVRNHSSAGNASVFAMNTESQAGITSPADTDADQLFATYSPRSGMDGANPADMMTVAAVVEALNAAGFPSTQNGWKSYF